MKRFLLVFSFICLCYSCFSIYSHPLFRDSPTLSFDFALSLLACSTLLALFLSILALLRSYESSEERLELILLEIRDRFVQLKHKFDLAYSRLAQIEGIGAEEGQNPLPVRSLGRLSLLRRILAAAERRINSVRKLVESGTRVDVQLALELGESKLCISGDSLESIVDSQLSTPRRLEEWYVLVEQLFSEIDCQLLMNRTSPGEAEVALRAS